MIMSPGSVQLHDYAPATELQCTQILAKLRLPAKVLPDELLWSERGSELHEVADDTTDYYVTRVELAILKESAQAMAACIGEAALLVEYGSGGSRKTRLLLDALPTLVGYVPIDISKEFLLATAQRIARDYPTLEVLPVCVDYNQDFAVPTPHRSVRRRVAYYPGSTIGNRSPAEAITFLRKLRQRMGDNGALLIGVDLKKDPQILVKAYGPELPDARAFLMSPLDNLNENYGADLDVTRFDCKTVYNEEKGRVEISFISLQTQTAHICGQPISFAAGEEILLLVSYKYTLAEFADLAHQAGWQVQQVWTDPQHWFSVQYLVPTDAQTL